MSLFPIPVSSSLPQIAVPVPTVFDGQKLYKELFPRGGDDFTNPQRASNIIRDLTKNYGTSNSSSLLPTINGFPTAGAAAQSTAKGINEILSPNFASSVLQNFNASLSSRNINPLTWQNPDSLDILFGTTNAASLIGQGQGLFPLNSNSLPPVIGTGANTPSYFYGNPYYANPYPIWNTPGYGAMPVLQPILIVSPTNPQYGNSQLTILIVQLEAIQKTLKDRLAQLEKDLAAANRMDRTGKEDNEAALQKINSTQAQITEVKSQILAVEQRLAPLKAVQNLPLQANNGIPSASPNSVLYGNLNNGLSGWQQMQFKQIQPFSTSQGAMVGSYSSQLLLHQRIQLWAWPPSNPTSTDDSE